MKYFYRKSGILTKHIQAWKVYDVMPEDMPEVFKKSKLVCYDSVDIEYSVSGLAKVKVSDHSMTDTEGMKKHLWQCIEISEEKFNSLYIKCTELKNEIKQAMEELK